MDINRTTAVCSVVLLFTAVTCFGGSVSGNETGSGWKGVGIRSGFSATSQHQFFHLYEAYTEYGLPWKMRSETGWKLSTQLNGELGVLKGSSKSCVVGAIGPGFAVGNPWNDVELDLGLSFNLLGERRFGYVDFGSTFLYGTYAGVSYRLYKGFEADYRFTHVSNGHFFYPKNTPNPGLNLHLFGFSWQFQ